LPQRRGEQQHQGWRLKERGPQCQGCGGS
jgi:hypothetical protein